MPKFDNVHFAFLRVERRSSSSGGGAFYGLERRGSSSGAGRVDPRPSRGATSGGAWHDMNIPHIWRECTRRKC